MGLVTGLLMGLAVELVMGLVVEMMFELGLELGFPSTLLTTDVVELSMLSDDT